MIDATEENSSWVIPCCLGKGVVDPDVTVVSSILAVVLSYDLGVQGDLSEDGLWEIGHIDGTGARGRVLVPPCCSLGFENTCCCSTVGDRVAGCVVLVEFVHDAGPSLSANVEGRCWIVNGSFIFELKHHFSSIFGKCANKPIALAAMPTLTTVVVIRCTTSGTICWTCWRSIKLDLCY